MSRVPRIEMVATMESVVRRVGQSTTLVLIGGDGMVHGRVELQGIADDVREEDVTRPNPRHVGPVPEDANPRVRRRYRVTVEEIPEVSE